MTAVLALAEAHAREHPGAVARMIEGARPEQIAELFAALEPEIAAELVARVVPLAGAQALERMEPAAAAAIVERVDPLQIAPLLRRVEGERRAAVLAALPDAARGTIERLLEYPSDRAAGRMDPRAPAVSKDSTAQQALEIVRAAAGGALNYVYVLDDAQRLVGVVSMRELMLTTPETPVGRIMTEDPDRLTAADPLTAVLAHPGWRKTHALPVVDGAQRYLGVIRYSTFRKLETEVGLTAGGPASSNTSAALAELFVLGTTAMGRLAEAAVLGVQPKEPGDD